MGIQSSSSLSFSPEEKKNDVKIEKFYDEIDKLYNCYMEKKHRVVGDYFFENKPFIIKRENIPIEDVYFVDVYNKIIVNVIKITINNIYETYVCELYDALLPFVWMDYYSILEYVNLHKKYNEYMLLNGTIFDNFDDLNKHIILNNNNIYIIKRMDNSFNSNFINSLKPKFIE